MNFDCKTWKAQRKRRYLLQNESALKENKNGDSSNDNSSTISSQVFKQLYSNNLLYWYQKSPPADSKNWFPSTSLNVDTKTVDIEALQIWNCTYWKH